MGFLKEAFARIVRKDMDAIARKIERELQAACPKRTGETARSFHVMEEEGLAIGVWANGANGSVFVGSDLDTARWANDGNGDGRIYPYGRALAFHGWGKYAGGGKGRGGKYVLPSVAAYEGSHFVEKVAARHR